MPAPSVRTAFETGASNIKRSRSVVDLSHSNTLTMVAGKLYPILAYSDVIPGDTHSLGSTEVLRSLAPVAPIMWDSYLQVEYYWVPNKLVLHRSSMTPSLSDSNHSWKAFVGAQDNLLNIGLPSDVELPSLIYDGNSSAQAAYKHSLAHYLDYPLLKAVHNEKQGSSDNDVFPVRFNPFAMVSFFKVWSDFYREPNLWNCVTYRISNENNILFTRNDNAGIPGVGVNNIYLISFPDVCREHGYFGSALPWPQRNATGVMLGLGEQAPIVGLDHTNALGTYGMVLSGAGGALGDKYLATGTSGNVGAYGDASGETLASVTSTNLAADLSAVPGLSINSFRYAMALQGYYEALARYGNRYDDILRIYGVTIDRLPDDQVEYLGGKRIPITATQVVNASASGGATLGQVGAMINVSDTGHYFTKSMNDFGTIIGVAFIRFPETRYNFLSKERSRIKPLDYWNPYFANIGEVEVKKTEQWIPLYGSGVKIVLDNIFQSRAADGSTSSNNSFGFQEYGADYRYHENCIHGEFLPVLGTLPGWTLLTNWDDIVMYDATMGTNPYAYFGLGMYLDGDTQVYAWDNVLSNTAASAGFQFQLQVYFDWKAVRQVRQNSIPALLGHS